MPALVDGEILIFGSNLAGHHGTGSALLARTHYGAEMGVGEGRTGNAYAIPTKRTWRDRGLPLTDIAKSVADCIAYAVAHPHLRFRLVKIGCGRAGHNESDIAPMWRTAPPNIQRPEGW